MRVFGRGMGRFEQEGTAGTELVIRGKWKVVSGMNVFFCRLNVFGSWSAIAISKIDQV
jgi:hypothetical protein